MAAPARRFLPAAAALSLALGLLAAAWTAAATPRRLTSLLRQYVDLRALREMSVPLAEPAAARAWAAAAPAAHGTAADWLAAAAPAWSASLRDEKADPAAPGWNLRRATLSRDAVPMAEVAALIEAGESQRPPWRIGSLTIEAVSGGGAVRTELTLERLERAGS